MAAAQPPETPPEKSPGPGRRQRPGAGAAKLALRDQVTTARRRLTVAELGIASRELAGQLLMTGEVRRAATVAAYVSIGNEPGTSWLLDGLVAAQVRVVLPVLMPDGDLDWATYAGASALTAGRFGLLEPTGRRLGVDAVAGADAVLVPGLAVSSTGMRLGRGGGSYDRALARVPVGTFTCVLLHDGEVDRPVPSEPHDRAVRAVATPSGVRRF